MIPPAHTNFGGLAEPPNDDDAVPGRFDGVGGPVVPPTHTPRERFVPAKPIPDPSTKEDWKPAEWPEAAAFTQGDLVLLDNWILTMETAIKAQERRVGDYAQLKAAALAALPIAIVTLGVTTWVAEFTTNPADSLSSLLTDLALMLLSTYGVLWGVHELPYLLHTHWWTSWRENKELLRKLEARLWRYEMRRNTLRGESSTGGE